MNQDILKINTLSIAAAGLLILLTGIILYFFRNDVSDNIRFFMPLPPLAVAAYIFVFNLYSHYGGALPSGVWGAAKEVLVGTAVAGIAFGIFAVLLIVIIDYFKS